MSETENSWPIRLKPGQTAKLKYGSDFKMDDFLMLELDEDILEEALDIGYVPCVSSVAKGPSHLTDLMVSHTCTLVTAVCNGVQTLLLPLP